MVICFKQCALEERNCNCKDLYIEFGMLAVIP